MNEMMYATVNYVNAYVKKIVKQYQSVGIAGASYSNGNLIFTLSDNSTLVVPLLITANGVSYDNNISGLIGTNVQSALDEIVEILKTDVRLVATISANMLVPITETQIIFNQEISKYGGISVTPTGTIKVDNAGVYTGTLTMHLTVNSKPSLWVWLEKKDATTGEWSLHQQLANSFTVSQDGNYNYNIGTSILLGDNDEIRIKIIKEGTIGTANLTKATKIASLGEIIQYPVLINIYKT